MGSKQLRLLVSRHVVCERLSARQGLSELFAHFAKNTLLLGGQQYPSPPPPQKIEICQELGTLSFDYPRIHPIPTQKLRFGQNLALSVLTTQEYSPPNIETWHFEFWLPKNTWYFKFWLSKNTPHPPPRTAKQNWNLARIWHFEFWLHKNTHSPTFNKGLQLECVETNRCRPPHLVLWGNGMDDKSQTRGSPMLVCKYVDEKGLAVMFAAKKSAGVAPEANPGRYHQTSKQGYQWPRKYSWCSQMFLFTIFFWP